MAELLVAILVMLLFIAAAMVMFLLLAASVETLVWAGHKITGRSYRWGDIVAAVTFDVPCECGEHASSNCPPNCPIKTGGGSGK